VAGKKLGYSLEDSSDWQRLLCRNCNRLDKSLVDHSNQSSLFQVWGRHVNPTTSILTAGVRFHVTIRSKECIAQAGSVWANWPVFNVVSHRKGEQKAQSAKGCYELHSCGGSVTSACSNNACSEVCPV